jgi:hypothetical protein
VSRDAGEVIANLGSLIVVSELVVKEALSGVEEF